MTSRRVLDDPDLDPYTRAVLTHIEPDVLDSLSDSQFTAIRHAVDAARPIRRHPVDIRGVIPLYFARYYYVFLAGRDRRQDTTEQELGRRRTASSRIGTVLLAIVLIVPVLVLLALMAYGVKSLIGVDLSPTQHLSDFLR
jgi:hypothetical protein